MGSSAKKKKEKKKDFQKTKLKVGKERPKNANVTDTSFKAKSVVVNKQTIAASAAPTKLAQFTHHLDLLNSRADSQRKESLAYLSNTISSISDINALPQPVAIIIPKAQPLIRDASSGVRKQLLKLFQTLPASEIPPHTEQLLLHIQAGLTHLAADIRSSSLDFLDWLLEAAGPEVVSAPGGWVKTLECFLSMLHWRPETGSTWSAAKPAVGKAGSDGKLVGKQLSTLSLLLKAGLSQGQDLASANSMQANDFPLSQFSNHMIIGRYNHLNLFGTAPDEKTMRYEDVEDRRFVFEERFYDPVLAGLAIAKREGGETGRAAAQVEKIVSVEGAKAEV